MKIEDNIKLRESMESAQTIMLYKSYFEYAISHLEKVNKLVQTDLIISFVLITTGLEVYLKSLIFDKYRSKPQLLIDSKEFVINGMTNSFKEFVQAEQPNAKFSHFNQPYELFVEFTVAKKRDFKDLLKWVYELRQIEQFQFHSNLCDFYKLRSLFIHFWEFPLNSQRVDEVGTMINLENIFELKIESLDQQYFVDFLDKIVLFLDHTSIDDTLRIRDKMGDLIKRLRLSNNTL